MSPWVARLGLGLVLAAALAVTVSSVRAQAPPRPGAPAPDVAGGGAWINSAPLTLAALRGRVVAVEFWTFG